MTGDALPRPCHARMLFGLGLTLGVVIGVAVGTVVALRLGSEAIGAVRGLFDRVSGRGNQVNFELLLQ
jgi:hypothetical protein